MLAMVLGEAISAKATCSSSSTLKEPLGETFGLPFLLAVAMKAGCVAAIILLASSDNLAVAHLLIERILSSAALKGKLRVERGLPASPARLRM